MLTLAEAASSLTTAEKVAAVLARVRNADIRPRCRGIDPDADEVGYFCTDCGYELIERGKWFRHGKVWRHPEIWLRDRR